MRATKIGDKVMVEQGLTMFVEAVVAKITATTVVVERANNSNPAVPFRYRFSGSLSTGFGKLIGQGKQDYPRLWLDPEMATVECARRTLQVQQAKEEKEKAQAAQRAEEDAELQELVDYATGLQHWPLTEEGEAAKEEQLTRYTIGTSWLRAHKEIVERSRRLFLDPASYFEWAEKDMQAAATVEFFGNAIYLMRKDENKLTAVQAMEAVRNSLRESLLGNRFSSNSSSTARNAMQDARRAVASNWAR